MDTIETHGASAERRSRDLLVHREILQIGVLVLVAVAGFLITRAVAANSRNITLRDAEAWYDRGEQLLSAGRVEDAIAALRRATVRNRYERKYAMGLANALERSGDTEAARSALLTLREASPEDAGVNLALARLAAQRQDVTEALRFYHNTLYAPWPADSDDRRNVRYELIDFLLGHDQTGRALSELLAMSADLPNDADAHVRVGQLFARAGDVRHALDQYERALRVAPSDGAALAGAGTSAFALGDYLQARSYLRRAPDDADDVVRTREVVELVLSNDPLARRIGSAERRRRVSASLDYVEQRLQDCRHEGAAATGDADPTGTLEQAIASLREQLNPPGSIDQDLIEAGIELVGRIEQRVAKTCPPMTARDQALALIARSHATASK